MRYWMALLVGLLANCSQDQKITPEYINPPIGLEVLPVAAQTYALSFYSDNREAGFSGYGIFVAADAAAAASYPAAELSAALAFCSNPGQTNYRSRVTIEVGPHAATGNLCNITNVLLPNGQYAAVRARVERTERPWSPAAIALIP
ncbi:MAG: hypothetical protein N2Z22_06855 [Turneriella sp.]|nr:hypothetical protein [Leptospiraceae bacterium]MCX7633032.1 hypothetical protein [Turneriella sp.]